MGTPYHYSPNSVEGQAQWYATQVTSKGVKALSFYPKRKTAGANSNRFRTRVLELLLVRKKPYDMNAAKWLTELEKDAEELGFSMVEVDPSEYC